MTSVELEHCVSCGSLEQTERHQYARLSAIGDHLEAVTPATGVNGVFGGRVDSDVVVTTRKDASTVDEGVHQMRDRS
ncbi:hypothetical protein [Natronorubrum bangense]|uniref:SelT/selW/selH selenoprotein domain-containing protein n=2 Tax=Natronorubrum bangense TaxID=61858 RepID=L9WTD9_9EURY|nr:hypothetical protein [Natronorubrum bangense]ELY52739.1 selT/selW/selH selenoprotein domain-containing protein [Natronorubrum bangense JCM 10635]QCC55190.1 selenoprotein [Natronorubrum bangense]